MTDSHKSPAKLSDFLIGIGIALVLIGTLVFYEVMGGKIDPDDALGLTRQQVRERFGEPDKKRTDAIKGFELWTYRFGIGGFNTLKFENGQVTSVTHPEK